MFKSKILAGLVLVFYLLFVIFELSAEYDFSLLFDSLLVPIITLIYIFQIKNKNTYFFLFLILYSLSDILGLATYFFLYEKLSYEENLMDYEYDYFIGSALYILAYMFLIVKVLRTISVKYVLRNFKIHLLVLTILNIYLIYVLQFIVKSNLDFENQYYIEFTYNVVMFLLLSASLINYFYRDNKKTLYVFLGSLLIVFSEVLDLAYIYIDQKNLLSVLSTTLVLAAFYFYCQQAKFSNKLTNKENQYMMLD